MYLNKKRITNVLKKVGMWHDIGHVLGIVARLAAVALRGAAVGPGGPQAPRIEDKRTHRISIAHRLTVRLPAQRLPSWLRAAVLVVVGGAVVGGAAFMHFVLSDVVHIV